MLATLIGVPPAYMLPWQIGYAFGDGSVSLKAAVNDPSKRQKHLTGLVGKLPENIIGVEYGTTLALKMLRDAIDLVPGKETTGLVIPILQVEDRKYVHLPFERIVKGTKSHIVVLPRFYESLDVSDSEREKNSEFLLKNAIVSNYFKIAEVYYNGFKDLPIDFFRDASGNLNVPLFNQAVLIIALASEYNQYMINSRARKSKELLQYAEKLKGQANLGYLILFHDLKLSDNMSRESMQSILDYFRPSNHFMDPRRERQV